MINSIPLKIVRIIAKIQEPLKNPQEGLALLSIKF